MFRTLSGWGRLFLLAGGLQASNAWAAPEPLSADQAVAYAIAAHPQIRRAETQVGVARGARSGAALFLNNPQLSAWVSTDLERTTFSAAQPLSLSGAGWHARSAAKHQVRSSEASLDRVRRRVAAQTRQSYVAAAVAAGTLQVAQEGAAVAKRLSYAVQRKHEEGEASLLELRLARLTEVQAAVRLMQARQAESGALRALASLTLQPVLAGSVTDPLAAAPAATEAATAEERSDVSALRDAVKALRSQLSLQRANALPPITLGVALQTEGQEMFVGPSVGFNLPVFNRNQRGRAQAVGSLQAGESMLQARVARAETEQTTARARVAEAVSLSDNIGDDLLDEAKGALSSIEAGVLAGEIDLSNAVLLQAQVLAGETALIQLRGLVASAQIDLLLATDDPALLGGAQ